MGRISTDPLALGQITSDAKVLLDSILSLHSLGAAKSFRLPQIVVVGDQSSGKSSVLEAISGLRFPIKNGVCTRFATEIFFRKRPQEEVSVRIIANDHIRQVAFDDKQFGQNDLPEIIEEAQALMGPDDDVTSFSKNTLRIGIYGPELAPLTLVDLPGFSRAEPSQEPREDASTALQLSEKYLKKKDCIILAVVSAQARIEEQLVFAEMQKHDPMRERTIGIITKPDVLVPGSIETRQYHNLAKNLQGPNTLKLGWHVLRSRDYHDSNGTFPVPQGTSHDSSDQKETDFFDSRACPNFPSSNNGAEYLRRQISRAFKTQIQRKVPSLIEEVETMIESQQNRLNSLGKARSSPSEIRQYLVVVAERLRDLTRAAVRGTYDDKFFFSLNASGLDEGDANIDQRKFRAVIRNLNRAFEKLISARGSETSIAGFEDTQFGDGYNRADPHHLDRWLDLFEVEEPVSVSWTNLETRLGQMASNDLGSQFPGSSNDRLALELFREQSRPWKGIAKQYLELAMDSARTFVDLALQHVTGADENTHDAIFSEYVIDYFDRIASQLGDKLDELLFHYQEGEIVCLEDEFRLRLSTRKTSGFGSHVRQTTQSAHSGLLATSTAVMPAGDYTPTKTASEVFDDDTGEFKRKQVVEIMMTYYEMSLQNFTNNVIVLAVENCLISKMASVFTPMAVLEMDDDTLLRLGSESQGSQRERLELQNNIAALKSNLAICKKHRPRPSSMFKATEKSSKGRLSPGSRETRRASPTPTGVSLALERPEHSRVIDRGIPSRDNALRASHTANSKADEKPTASVNTTAIAKCDDTATPTAVSTGPKKKTSSIFSDASSSSAISNGKTTSTCDNTLSTSAIPIDKTPSTSNKDLFASTVDTVPKGKTPLIVENVSSGNAVTAVTKGNTPSTFDIASSTTPVAKAKAPLIFDTAIGPNGMFTCGFGGSKDPPANGLFGGPPQKTGHFAS